MNYKIEYNKAVEFIGAILKYSSNTVQQSYSTNKDFDSDSIKRMLDFSPSKEVKDWIKYINDNISPFLQNDIIFITKKVYGLLDICFDLITKQDLNDPLEMIEAIKSLDNSILVKMSYEYYDLDIPLDSPDTTLKSVLLENYPEEIASTFMQIKSHPEEYKEHIIKSFKSFYDLFYQPFEESTYNHMQETLKSHNELFQKDPLNFINTIGLGDYSKVVDQYAEMKIYVSFYIDLGLFYFFLDDEFILFYGQTIEEKFESKKTQDTYKALFKAVSDDRRLEIIKMTSKRPWYNKELADHFNLSTATLSYHLNLLLNLGILNFEPSINNRYYYSTNKENLLKLFDIALKGLLE